LLPPGYEAQLGLVTAGDRRYLIAVSQGPNAATVALMTVQGAPIYTLRVESHGFDTKSYLPLDNSLTPDNVLRYVGVVYRNGEDSEWNAPGRAWNIKESSIDQAVELELLEWARVLPE
jgi:hypothetical protein